MNAVQKEISDRIRRYFTMGLTYAEIGKLLDMSSRTVQRYVSNTGINVDFKTKNAPKTPQQKALELSENGYTYSEIAKRMKVTRQTVYNWHRKHKEKTAEN